MAEKVKKRIASLSDFDTKYKGGITNIQELVLNSDFYSTGSVILDRALRGGLPSGKMVELYGPPASGKSTAAISTGGVALENGLRVAHVDLERSLDLGNEKDFLESLMDENQKLPPNIIDAMKNAGIETVQAQLKKRQSWLRKNGIDPFHPNFRLLDPDNGEHLFEMLADIVSGNIFDIVIVDSVAAIITRAELEGDAGESHYGQVAKLLSTELRRLERLYKGNPKTTIIWINQVRDKVGFMQKGQKSTGGHALEHYVSTKVKFTKIGRKEVGDDILTETLIKVEKHRFGSSGQHTLWISNERGIDTLSELLEFGVDFGYVHTSGAWFYLFTEPVTADEFKAAKGAVEEIETFAGKAQGKAGALEILARPEWRDKLYPLATKVGQ